MAGGRPEGPADGRGQIPALVGVGSQPVIDWPARARPRCEDEPTFGPANPRTSAIQRLAVLQTHRAERVPCAMCGRIWTPPYCNGLVGSGLAITIADVYPASLSGPIHRRREPRWISARFSLNGSKAQAVALPVHTSGSRSGWGDPFTISCQFAAIFLGKPSFSRLFRCRCQFADAA